jgi:hypothetical protein
LTRAENDALRDELLRCVVQLLVVVVVVEPDEPVRELVGERGGLLVDRDRRIERDPPLAWWQ